VPNILTVQIVFAAGSLVLEMGSVDRNSPGNWASMPRGKASA